MLIDVPNSTAQHHDFIAKNCRRYVVMFPESDMMSDCGLVRDHVTSSQSVVIATAPTAGLCGVPEDVVADKVFLAGRIIDADSENLHSCRLYLQNLEAEEWYLATHADPADPAIEYRERIGTTSSVEIHTALSAHPFQYRAPSGNYRIRAEHGKKYVPDEQQLIVGADGAEIVLRLKRFDNMAALGWFSGDTHVHRTMNELPNLIPAEDLNVALPLNY